MIRMLDSAVNDQSAGFRGYIISRFHGNCAGLGILMFRVLASVVVLQVVSMVTVLVWVF